MNRHNHKHDFLMPIEKHKELSRDKHNYPFVMAAICLLLFSRYT